MEENIASTSSALMKSKSSSVVPSPATTMKDTENDSRSTSLDKGQDKIEGTVDKNGGSFDRNEAVVLNDVSKSVTAHSLNPSTFTQKLYVMLQDENLKDVIFWNEETKNSFFIVPNERFIQVLSIFFKHCNTSSFVRQLNMYSFHKISGNTSSLWEFKHAQSLFEKDNIESLYKVKRRFTGGKTGANKIIADRGEPQLIKRKSLGALENSSAKKRPRVSSLPNNAGFQQKEKNAYFYRNSMSHVGDLKMANNGLNPPQNISAGTEIYSSAVKNPLNINALMMNSVHNKQMPNKPMSFLSEEETTVHNLMLKELNLMNTNLQNMCEVVELSCDDISNSSDGLSIQKKQMYRKRLDELCIDLREKEHSLRQYFDMQFGSGIIINQSPTHYSLVTPSTPFGSVSYQSGQNISTNLKNSISQPQSIYSMEGSYSNIQYYDPGNPYGSVSIPPQHQPQPVSKLFQLPGGGYPVQTQFRDVKYEDPTPNTRIPTFNKLYSPVDSIPLQVGDPNQSMQPSHSINPILATAQSRNHVARNNSLPKLKDVINMNSIAKLTAPQQIPKCVLMNQSKSDGSPST